MKLRTYKILSIVFIVVGIILAAVVLFSLKGMPLGQKIVFAVCVIALVGAMSYNLKVISKKQEDKKK